MGPSAGTESTWFDDDYVDLVTRCEHCHEYCDTAGQLCHACLQTVDFGPSSLTHYHRWVAIGGSINMSIDGVVQPSGANMSRCKDCGLIRWMPTIQVE